MVVAGLLGIAAGSAVAAWWSMRRAMRGRLELALAVNGLAALAAFAIGLVLAGPLASFLVSGAAILVGLAVAIARGGADDEPGGGPGDDPPWWPSFERDLRDYERRGPARPRSRARA